MTQIVLTPEQAAVLAGSESTVRLCAPDGSIVGYGRSGRFITPKEPVFTPEEIAAAERSIDEYNGPWHTTAEVLEHLRSLDKP